MERRPEKIVAVARTVAALAGPVSIALAASVASCGARTSLDDQTVDARAPADTNDAGILSPPVVLFGGTTGGIIVTSDTWTWNGVAWAHLEVAGPSARSNATMSAFNGTSVLFGGNIPTFESDTWIWSGSAWTELAVPGPSARANAAMAPLKGNLYLFGGNDGNGVIADTWKWNGAEWTQLDVVGPSARGCAVMAPLDDVLVLFGGDADADTWTWDGATWTRLDIPGPSLRLCPVMAALGNELVLFGGSGANGFDSDTWTFDGTTWTQLAVTGPPGRWGASMVAVGDGSLMLFGGEIEKQFHPEDVIGDTWIWNGSTWTALDVPGPSPRMLYVMSRP